MRTQCHFDVYLLPRYSNLKMLDVDKILESFLAENADVRKKQFYSKSTI